MTVTITHQQQAWLLDHVSRGEFRSIEEGVRQLLDERMAERATEEGDDLVWARADVDQARADVAVGRVLTRQDHEARMDAQPAAHKG